jgi:putative transposase
VIELVTEAEANGAGFQAACETIGLCARTVHRWASEGKAADMRKGPLNKPAHTLTEAERAEIVKVATSPEFRDLSPKQIVPTLADRGIYIASESSFYRVLWDAKMMAHRAPCRPQTRHKPSEYVASGPGQVWTWDITYLRARVKGTFYYLYMVLDIFSRKIVAGEVHAEESSELSQAMIERTCIREAVDTSKLKLHSDNGGPMKGATMLATLQKLGIAASFSRPSVSDDNPYIESLFRTLKFRPGYPRQPFESLEQAQQWVDQFVVWYNQVHLHSALRYVAPNERHRGQDKQLLQARHALYQSARRRTPERWTQSTRNWTPIGDVVLNPAKAKSGATH